MTPLIEKSVPDHWHTDIPGSRWFRCDFHVHTLDDHPGGRIKAKTAFGGWPADPDVQTAYATELLRTAVARGIQVIGLTPHAVRSGDADDTSATWRIIDVWRDGRDSDGVPFRDKIYAVFPGFEPSLSDGARGVHLLFLFDPAIGRDCYLRAFHAVMGGIQPWQGATLRNSGHTAKAVFENLQRLRREEHEKWDFMCLAPHAFAAEKGLFALKSQILQDFLHRWIRALAQGHPRYGGRKKGSVSKRTKQAREIAESLGFHPIEWLSHVAMHGTMPNPDGSEMPVDAAMRLDAAKRLRHISCPG